MKKVKEPSTWSKIALEGTIVDFEGDTGPDPDNTDVDLITQLIDDGIPTIEKEEDNNIYYVSFDNDTIEHHNFKQPIQEYLRNNSLVISVNN